MQDQAWLWLWLKVVQQLSVKQTCLLLLETHEQLPRRVTLWVPLRVRPGKLMLWAGLQGCVH